MSALRHRLNSLFKKSIKACFIRASVHPIMEILGGFSIVVVILSGGLQVIQGTQTTGSFLTFITALLFIYQPIKKIIRCNSQLQEGLASAERIQEVLDLSQYNTQDVGPKLIITESAIDFGGPLIFEKVCFGYPGTHAIIQDLSCLFQGQKNSAIVGPSGAGKSTLFQLLLRFYFAQKGKILIGNTDILTIPLEKWRQCMAFVGQNIALFDESVAYNIGYGIKNVSLKAIERAAELAFADEFICKLPQGYNTTIGSNGVKLSGGQRQRIALARAFLKDAPLLFLDEATSSLDTISEGKIQKAIKRLTFQRTTLVIAHRLSTIESADCIFVMQNGRFIEQGSHQQLMRAKGFYEQLALFQESVA